MDSLRIMRLSRLGEKFPLPGINENKIENPDSNKGYGRFFSRQRNLDNLKIEEDMWEAMIGIKAIVMNQHFAEQDLIYRGENRRKLSR